MPIQKIKSPTKKHKKQVATRKVKKRNSNFVIVRTYSAGVFAGNLVKRKGREVILTNAIRIWKWDGAASLSQLAMEGVKNIDGCKFGMPVDEILLLEAIEILNVSYEAENNIRSVKPWKV